MVECKRCKNTDLILGKCEEYHDLYECPKCEWQTIIRIDDCCRNPQKMIVRHEQGGASYAIVRQCRSCGGRFNKDNQSLSSKVYKSQIEQKSDEEALEVWKQAVRSEYNRIREGFREMWIVRYLTYINSTEWREKRLLVMQRDNYTCQDCKATATEVHHVTYANFKKEKLEDLIALCCACHDKIHKPQY